ncbi:MAG TPA: Spy/CpxP family protein refolding chaperone [Hyphomicrobiaceae bacterium]|nr:Spy/CpxP family protein refolding chaperone [Hyphomicrobiaceae bacterium]
MSNASTSGDERDKYGMAAEDYRRLKARTDEEITAALADPDHPPLTDERLARFRRPALARRIRQKLHMGRENFSATYGSPVETLRAWQRHELAPTSHPGTLHVMELAEELRLTPAQRQMVQRVYERMKARAKALGKAYVAAEKAVDKAFKSGTADAAEVAARVAEANRLLGEVRLSHLQAHVEITPLLTPEQRTRYAELRGYAGSGPRQHMHKH